MAAKTKAMVAFEAFEGQLQDRADDIAAELPPNVPKKKFLACALAAVKQTPELLQATPRSLFTAITKSAQDGIMPDGREGVITVYKTKNKATGKWDQVAQWNPMAFGLRKRARELDGILVNSQVVRENDEFDWEEGDEPRIIHRPATLGTERGKIIGVYAIFKNDSGILHREVMDKAGVEDVRGQSKSPNGLLWTKFETEGYRKTVVRRGFKSVPCSPALDTVVARNDEDFDFTEPQVVEGPKSAPTMVEDKGLQEIEDKINENPINAVADAKKTIEEAPAEKVAVVNEEVDEKVEAVNESVDTEAEDADFAEIDENENPAPTGETKEVEKAVEVDSDDPDILVQKMIDSVRNVETTAGLSAVQAVFKKKGEDMFPPDRDLVQREIDKKAKELR